MISRAVLALAALALAGAAAALETAQWPPPAPVEARMRELQQVIASRDATRAERDAAREELSRLLSSPARRDRGAKAPAPRAAIDPYPSVVKPLDAAPAPAPGPGVAQVEVVPPSRPMVNPKAGTATQPSGRFAIDPRTGALLHETPGGYLDPRTGQFVPRQ